MLSLSKGRAGKGACALAWQDMAAHGEGLLAVLLPDQADDALRSSLARLRGDFGDRAYRRHRRTCSATSARKNSLSAPALGAMARSSACTRRQARGTWIG